MKESIIFRKVNKLVNEVRHEKNGLLDNETNLIYDIGLSSVELLTLIAMLEEEFNITIPDDDYTLDNFEEVQEMVRYISGLLNGVKGI